DTYPDKNRIKKLFVYDLVKNDYRELGLFYESMSFFSYSRCDLHPRISVDNRFLFVDSVHSGKRKLYFMRSGICE
ncbi:glycosyl transferase, partial [Shigella sonnei]|nr:glycosyl transferase [Shigella sonnei]EFW8092579.1 glycosyl transferase [Shigella sonnei]EFX8099190.1 glycosyl transferase [Shigella sonnei]EFY0827822.1 glycosyl transferase [Shigella sonnei]EFY1675839.1 glycosyl transferase [Shigella sonnei]